MAIIAQALSSLLAFLPRSIAILGGGIGILLFTLLSGATATAVRAAFMATLVLVSKLVYRPQLGLRLLCVTGIGMLLYSPLLLLDSLSFQLSFLATASVMTFQHTLQESRMFIAYIPNAIRELLATTIAALIGVLPLLMYTFHATSIIAPLSNILVLPVIPFAMFCVFIVGTFGFLPIIPVVFSWMGELLLRYVFVVSNVLSYIPGSLITVEWVSLSVMLAMYGVLASIGYRVLNTQLQETNPIEGRVDVIL